MASPWEKEKIDLQLNGFSEEEIGQELGRQREEMLQSGFGQHEVDDYFGVKEPDMTPLKQEFQANLAKAAEEKKAKGTPKTADSFFEAIEAGWQNSVNTLLMKGAPDTVLPEHAPMYYRIASQVAQLAGDIPAMVAGGVGGGMAGSVLPGPGNVAGAAFGTFALPAAMRKILMDHYEKGDIKSSEDFWQRASSTFIETMNSGAIGVATAGAGIATKAIVGPMALTPIVKTSSVLASEVAAMTTAGAAVQGKIPEPQDFLDTAILVGGMHGAMKVASNVRSTFAKTGLKPAEIFNEAQSDPTVIQDLNSKNVQVPKNLEKFVEPDAPKPVKEVTPKVEEPVVRSEAEQKILSKIGEKQPGTKTPYSFGDFYTDFFDKLNPIKQAMEKLDVNPDSLTTAENPYQLARMANDYKAKAKHVFERGTYDYRTLENNGKGLQQILEPVKSDLEGFDAYVASKRALEIEAKVDSKGKPLKSGFDTTAALQVVKEGEAKYGAAANELVEFQNRILENARDAGILDQVSFEAIKKNNQAYVPFARLLSPEEAGNSPTGKKGTSSLKKLEGSDKAIQSPLLSVFENTKNIIQAVEINRAKSAFFEMVDKIENQTLVEKVKSRTNVVEISAKEFQKQLDLQGIDADAQTFEVFRKQAKIPLAADEVSFQRDGKREVRKFKDVRVAEALNSLDGDINSQYIAVKILNGITSVKKIGITLTPDFIIKNIFRDQLTSGVFSEGGAVPFKNIVSAMGDIIGKKDVYFDWLKSGGANGGFLELNKSYLEKNVFELNKQTGFIDSAFNVMKKPVDYLKAAGELAEQSTRLAEFKAVTKGARSGDAIFKGGFSSREVTLDFQRIGAKMSALNAITAFQNVSIQGLDKTVRAMKEDPMGVSIKGLTYLTAPSILLWWANKDDERYKELPRWQKDLFWIILTDNWQKIKDASELNGLPDHLIRKVGDSYEVNRGTIYRFPKPGELGILFGSVPERIMEQFFTDNPRALKGFQDTVQNLVTPSVVPDAITPVFEQFANKSYFTQAPIVPYSAEKLLPQYQYSNYTTETAKQIAKMIAVVPGLRDVGTNDLKIASPMVIENYVKSWSGSLGGYALQLMDQALIKSGAVDVAPKPTTSLADIPVVKAFVVRYPSAGSQSIIDFRDRYESNKKVVDTIKAMGQQGNVDEMQTLIANNQEKLIVLEDTKIALTNLGQAVNKVNQNKDFSPGDKRQMIDGLYYTMIQAAKNGNKILDEMEKIIKDQKK